MLTALRGGCDQWNSYRVNQGNGWTPVLDGMDLRGVNLQHESPHISADLRGASMVGVRGDNTTTLARADLQGATIANSDLSGVNARGANLSQTVIYNNNAPGINLRGANLDDANIQHNKMPNADLETARLARSTFAHNDISHSTVAGMETLHSYVGHNNFQGTTSETTTSKNIFAAGTDDYAAYEKLNAADRQTKNIPADFKFSKLEDNDFSHANLPELHTGESVLTPNNNFSGANLSESRHNGSQLQNLNLSEAELGESFFRGTNLKGTKATGEQAESILKTGGDKVGTDNMGAEMRKDRNETYPVNSQKAAPIPAELTSSSASAPAPAPENTPAPSGPPPSAPAPPPAGP